MCRCAFVVRRNGERTQKRQTHGCRNFLRLRPQTPVGHSVSWRTRLRVLRVPRSFAIIYTIDPLHHRSTYHFINPRESIAMTAPSSTEVKKRKRRMGQTGQREQGEQGVKEGQRKRERVRRHTLLLLNLVNHASTRRGFDESQKHPQPCGDRRGGGAPSFILS